MHTLNPADQALLEFARETENLSDDRKYSLVMDRFQVSITRYYQRLNGILKDSAAEAWDPELVRRLNATAERRRKQRSRTHRDALRAQG